MLSDSAFIIGSTHKVCQDYAKHNSDLNIVVISDGCSSSPDTDVGSRVLTSILSRHLEWNVKNSTEEYFSVEQSSFNEILIQSRKIIELLGFSQECLDATLLSLYLDNNTIKVLTWGDGCVVARIRETGELIITDLEYPDGYPYYLNYSLNSKRNENYLSNNHGLLNTTINILNGKEISLLSISEGIQPFSFYAFDISKYDLVAVMSDGIRDFNKSIQTETTKINNKLPSKDIINKLFDFKSYNGPFIQKRLNKVIKELNKENIFNFDDFSIGAIYVD